MASQAATAPTNDIDTDTENTIQSPSELDMLKQRAVMMGLKFSNNISLETLKLRVQAKMDGEPDPVPESVRGQENPLEDGSEAPVGLGRPETTIEIRARLQRDYMMLIRCRITNMDPKKADLPGEIFTIANEYLGTIRKYVPYGEVTDNGYHLPRIIYDELNARKFLNIRTSKKGGQIHVEQNWAKEFALEVLEPLTEQELARLAATQAAAGGIKDNDL